MTDFDYIIDLCSKDNQQKNWTITFTEKSPTVTLTNKDLVADSISFTESVISGNEIKFGQLERSQISFKFANTDNISFMKYDIFTVLVNIGGYVIDIGTFQIETATPDKNGLFDIIGYSADSYLTDFLPSKFNEPAAGTIGYMYYWLLNEIGMSVVPNGYNESNYLSFSETINTIIVDNTVNIAGNRNGYKAVYYEKICTVSNEIKTTTNHYFPFLKQNQYSMSKVISYGVRSQGYVSFFYSGTGGSGSGEWDRFADKRYYPEYGLTVLDTVKIYDKVKIYSVVNSVETLIEELNMYDETKLLYANYETIGNPNGLINGGWSFRPKKVNGIISTLSATSSEILSAICELNGVCIKQNRNNNFDLFNFKSGTSLFPSVTLFPSTTLYPNGSIFLYDLQKQYLNALEYTKSNRNYFRRLITPLVPDSINTDVDNVLLDKNGSVDYDISNNILLNTFTFDIEFYYQGDSGLNVLISQMTNIKLDTFSLKAIGLPNVPTGSKIEIQTPSGEIVQSIIMQRQLKGIQHLEDTIKNNINGGI